MPAAYLLGERGEHHLIGWNLSSERVGLESAQLTAGPTLPTHVHGLAQEVDIGDEQAACLDNPQAQSD
jgi:hypothetical protein